MLVCRLANTTPGTLDAGSITLLILTCSNCLTEKSWHMNISVPGLLADQASYVAFLRNSIRVAPKSFQLKEEVTYFHYWFMYPTPPLD